MEDKVHPVWLIAGVVILEQNPDVCCSVAVVFVRVSVQFLMATTVH